MVPKKPRKESAVIKQPEHKADELADSVIDTVREPVIALDHDLKVVKVNRSFYETFKLKPEETVGQHIYDMGNKQLDIPRLRELLESIIPQTSTYDGYEIEYDFPAIGRRTMLVNARQIPGVLGKEKVTLLAIEDITERRQAEMVGRESEERLLFALDCIETGEWDLDLIDHTAHRSLKHDQIFGYETLLPQWTFEMFLEHVVPEDRADVDRKFKQAVESQGDWNFECRITRRDGEQRWIMARGQHRLDPSGQPRRMAGIVQDITVHKQVEMALLGISEEKYQTLVENINDVLMTLDTQGNITYISPVVEQLSHYKVSDLTGKPFTQHIHPDDLPALSDRFTRLLSGQLEPWEFRILDKDGGVIFVRTSSRPRYADGQVVGITTLMTDITQRKKIEEMLKGSELRYRNLVNNSKNGVAIYEAAADGHDFIIKDFNRAAESIENVKKEDIIGKSLLYVFPGVKEFGLVEVLQRVWRTGVPERHPLRWYHDERISGWRDSYVYRLPSGEIVAIYEDVTARKQSDDSLPREQIMLARTEGIGHIGSWEWDIATDTVIWSEELFRIFQRDPQEGAPSFAEHPALYHPDDMARLRQAVEACVADGTPYELEMRANRKDGETRICIARGVAEIGPSGESVRLVGSLQDVTERRRAEEALKESEVRFRELFNCMSSGVAVYKAIDNGGDFIFNDFNPAAEKIEKVSSKDILGKRVSEAFTGVKTFGIFEVFQRVWQTGIAEYFPEHIYTDDRDAGSWRESWVFKLPNGEIVAVYNDVSERKLTEEKLLKSYESLQKTLHDSINTMVKIVEMRDPYTSGHQQKVADLATAIAGAMKLDDARIDQLRMSAVVHDIGKMYIPSDILSKPGKLANIEFNLIKTHSQGGYDIVKSMDLPGSVANTVLQHHERLDGSGYPHQLKGEDTLLEAKILAVADVVEAMSSHRPYRPALGLDQALEEISNNKGRLYDPDVVEICLELFKSGRFQFKTV